MARDAEWMDCPWDPGEARLLVRGLAKSLIQARSLAEPGFLPAEQAAAWFPPDGAELRAGGRAARTLLGHAATDARRLQAVGVLPDHWHTSATLIPGPAVAGELVSAVQRLLAGDVDLDDPVAALEQAARPSDPPGGWEELIDWGELAELHRLLELLPAPLPRPPVVRPHWDPHAGVLKYGRWVARRVDPQAFNIRALLAACDAAGWAARIASPFGFHVEVLHDTLKRLRRGLKHISRRVLFARQSVTLPASQGRERVVMAFARELANRGRHGAGGRFAVVRQSDGMSGPVAVLAHDEQDANAMCRVQRPADLARVRVVTPATLADLTDVGILVRADRRPHLPPLAPAALVEPQVARRPLLVVDATGPGDEQLAGRRAASYRANGWISLAAFRGGWCEWERWVHRRLPGRRSAAAPDSDGHTV